MGVGGGGWAGVAASQALLERAYSAHLSRHVSMTTCIIAVTSVKIGTIQRRLAWPSRRDICRAITHDHRDVCMHVQQTNPYKSRQMALCWPCFAMAMMVYSPSQGWTHPLKAPPSMLFFNVLLMTSSMSVWYRRIELSAYACTSILCSLNVHRQCSVQACAWLIACLSWFDR